MAERLSPEDHAINNRGSQVMNEYGEVQEKARRKILGEEICEGLELLCALGSDHFEVLFHLVKIETPDTVQLGTSTWTSSLLKFHGALRVDIISKSPKVLEWLERFLDAIEIFRNPKLTGDGQSNTPNQESS